MKQANDSKSRVPEVMSDKWISISDKEYKQLTNVVYKHIGINLTEEKRNLLMGRLQKVLREKKFESFEQYYEYIIKDKTGSALSELANYISTNHTFFYREKDHFEFFIKTALPELVERLKATKSNDIRIWSAGCSSGEEPYNLVMLMMHFFGSSYKQWNAGILATDISEKALNTAKTGIYSYDRIKNLPDDFQKKYFRKTSTQEYEVIDEVKREVTYRKFNLMKETFPFKKNFDMIFCRNVMIYFDEPTRETLVEKFYSLTANDGYFFIGHSETLKRDRHKFKFILPALYKKV